MKRRLPILAVVGSLFEPGIGLVYIGLFNLGLLFALAGCILQFCILFSGILRSFYATIAAYALVLLVPRLVAAIYSGVQSARVRSITLSKLNRWYVYLLLAALPHVPGRLIPLIRNSMPCNVAVLPTGSMQPSIEPDELIVIDRKYYASHSLVAGDVVAFRSPFDSNSTFVKRCVAIAGQKVQIRDGVLFVNAQQFAPKLALKRTTSRVLPPDFNDGRMKPVGAGNEDQYGPVTVPDSCYFMLGDHRDNSLDSRYFGFVSQRDIMGKVLYVLSSQNLGRIGQTVF